MARNKPLVSLSEDDQAFIRGLVLYEDDELIAFNKPSGLPVQTRGNRGRNLDHLLWAFARSNGKRPRLVHRIDSGTSGLVIAAKTKPAAVRLSEAFAARQVTKTYLAFVCGDLPSGDHGEINALLAPSKDRPPRSLIVPDTHANGQQARTRWHFLARTENYALVEAVPVTGRMHQIRAHLAHLGCPILGDHLYGQVDIAPRLMLHAARLVLPGLDGTSLALEAPEPETFEMMRQKLGL